MSIQLQQHTKQAFPLLKLEGLGAFLNRFSKLQLYSALMATCCPFAHFLSKVSQMTLKVPDFVVSCSGREITANEWTGGVTSLKKTFVAHFDCGKVVKSPSSWGSRLHAGTSMGGSWSPSRPKPCTESEMMRWRRSGERVGFDHLEDPSLKRLKRSEDIEYDIHSSRHIPQQKSIIGISPCIWWFPFQESWKSVGYVCGTNNPASKACHSGGLAAKNLWKGILPSSQHEKSQIEEHESGVSWRH